MILFKISFVRMIVWNLCILVNSIIILCLKYVFHVQLCSLPYARDNIYTAGTYQIYLWKASPSMVVHYCVLPSPSYSSVCSSKYLEIIFWCTSFIIGCTHIKVTIQQVISFCFFIIVVAPQHQIIGEILLVNTYLYLLISYWHTFSLDLGSKHSRC